MRVPVKLFGPIVVAALILVNVYAVQAPALAANCRKNVAISASGNSLLANASKTCDPSPQTPSPAPAPLHPPKKPAPTAGNIAARLLAPQPREPIGGHCGVTGFVARGQTEIGDCFPVPARSLPAQDPAAVEPVAAPVPAPVPVVAITESDLRALPIAPSGLVVEPPAATVLINMPTIAYSGSAPQTFTIEQLGIPVVIRVEPAAWTWDFQEGEPFTTTTPGRPYPHQTIFREYRKPTGPGETRTISLTTHWQGWWSLDVVSWLRIDGDATTTETSAPFEVVELRSRIVETR